jgi:hypothetical protein
MTPQPKATRREVSTFWERAQRFERKNLEAAAIIASDPERHGGEGSGLLIWARRVLARRQERRAA